MKIEITGSKCISCWKYEQYFRINARDDFEAIDCGYCWLRHCTTRPGNRCKHYQEKSNVGVIYMKGR